jgi:hypothetical protein
MAEVLIEFDNTWQGADGKLYEARACGRGRDDGLWEGWLEFTPNDGSDVLATERETTQPNRADTLYWATGLTFTYIDGALRRLLKPLPRLSVRPQIKARPAFSGPAPRRPPRPTDSLGSNAILDPFAVFRESDTVLRGQLMALDEGQLRNIVREFKISDMNAMQLAAVSHAELVAMIMAEVRRSA